MRLNHLLIVIFAFNSLHAQLEQLEQSRAAYNQGVEAYRAQKFETSREHFERALSLRPNHPGLMVTLAGISTLAGEHEQAIALLQRLADMQVVFPIDEDADFDAIRERQEFKGILQEFDRIRQPISKSEIALELQERDLVTESVAFDAQTQTCYISSVHKRKIVAVDQSGVARDFADAHDGLWSVQALKLDAQRNVLWASTSAMEQMRDFQPAQDGKAAIAEFDLETGALRNRFVLDDEDQHIFGDFILASDGRLMVSDSKHNAIYRLSPESGKYEMLIAPGHFASLQGLAFSPDGTRLLAADYSQGIFIVNLKETSVTRLSQPDTVCTLGIDGLYWYENSLIATQNGIRPHRVVRLHLDAQTDAITRAELLAMNHPRMEDPTLGCIVNDMFYFVANSQWQAFGKNGNLPPAEQMQAPTILKVRL